MFTLPAGTAILLMAHGSRMASANDDLRCLADRLCERFPEAVIETAYLELAEPTIPQGAAACVRRGAVRVALLPYFLSAGTHVTEDLRRYQTAFAAEWPHVHFDLCPPLGLHPQMTDILCDRLSEGLIHVRSASE